MHINTQELLALIGQEYILRTAAERSAARQQQELDALRKQLDQLTEPPAEDTADTE